MTRYHVPWYGPLDPAAAAAILMEDAPVPDADGSLAPGVVSELMGVGAEHLPGVSHLMADVGDGAFSYEGS